ncbi:hypothetical protein XMM379_001879 [Aliiroseovarius sp. xm-m-379]|uniref:Uncharacterized protein n=1 Tax=Aliiroseovarius crassostreae TaxID=154981 RepID=A0A9Q9M0P5_9RHOB|nr:MULTISPECIES: hypothetical protein [Aliiroseovarius]NRP11964.1 hypothetical protein [Aliiroseovarius sp. xm-d-517]NRP25187.1 hypothetical protein [Aliiroseovarius sp. xm-m-379]NRP31081.1 hypothetical protein [Aliiroseovarius sp. xm-m-314]NRP33986.1 hypothetical protein [Aliiroseovarius sp. xm-a-104]NRP41542.1 hypothetical protein [Aliiroseovarius sp. xm-m-339-2]
MDHIQNGLHNGYRGLSLLLGLNFDRFLSAGAILVALSLASIMVNLFL